MAKHNAQQQASQLVSVTPRTRAQRISREYVGSFSRFAIDLQQSSILGELSEAYIVSDAEQRDELDLPLVVALELVKGNDRAEGRERAIRTASRVVGFDITADHEAEAFALEA